MKVIKYLQKVAFETSPQHALDRLNEEHGIRIKQYDDRIVLNYDLLSEKLDPIACECRGLILSFPYFSVLSRGFDRFFNYGEIDHKETFNISRAETFSKEDGSYVATYFDDSQWNIATRGLAFAEGESFSGTPFIDLFLRTLGNFDIKTFQEKFSVVGDSNWTFMFELCTRENRVVKQYEEDAIFFLAARHKFSPDEWIAPTDDQAKILIGKMSSLGMNIQLPKTYTFRSFDEVLTGIKELPGLDEGYVLWDRKTNQRIKCKSPSYLAVHHIRDNGNISPKRITTLVFENDFSEYLSYFPEDQKYFDPYINAYEKMKKDIFETFDLYKNIEDQKEFALKVKDLKISGMLFNLRKGMKIEDIFSRLSQDSKINFLEFYKE